MDISIFSNCFPFAYLIDLDHIYGVQIWYCKADYITDIKWGSIVYYLPCISLKIHETEECFKWNL